MTGDELTPLKQRRSFQDAFLITGQETVCPADCVKQSAVLIVSLKHTNTQSAIQFRVRVKMNSQERRNNVTFGEQGGVNSKCQQRQIFSFTYGGADKSLARPGRKQANVSVRMAFDI